MAGLHRRKMISSHQTSLLYLVLAWTTLVFLAIYFLVRLYYYSQLPFTAVNFIFASFLLLAEIFIFYQTAGSLIQIIRLRFKRRQVKPRDLPEELRPWLTIVVPVRNEPSLILEQTLITVAALDYQRKRLVLLDGSDAEFISDNQRLCQRYQFEWWTPTVKAHSKAEIINKYLPSIQDDYLVIFDADQSPLPDFLGKVVSIAVSHPKVAFVQTPQFYANAHVSPIAKGASMQQAIFFEGICEAKASFGSMFCCGTNVLLRVSALRQVGGFNESSITEDFVTSIDLHAAGYESVYYNHVRVFGLAPESLSAYFKQQFRWAAGTIGGIPKLFKVFLKDPESLTLAQWWEYSLSATYYLTGLSFVILMLGPILFLFFGIPVYFMSPQFYLGSFLPFFIMNLTTYYINMRRRNYDWHQLVNGLIMSVLSFPVLLAAIFSALSGRKLSFKVTPKLHSDELGWYAFWPWKVAISLNVAAIIIGLWKQSLYESYALGVNLFWCLYHALILSAVFKYNRAAKLDLEPSYAPLTKAPQIIKRFYGKNSNDIR